LPVFLVEPHAQSKHFGFESGQSSHKIHDACRGDIGTLLIQAQGQSNRPKIHTLGHKFYSLAHPLQIMLDVSTQTVTTSHIVSTFHVLVGCRTISQ
jgi:hypothetical protein